MKSQSLKIPRTRTLAEIHAGGDNALGNEVECASTFASEEAVRFIINMMICFVLYLKISSQPIHSLDVNSLDHCRQPNWKKPVSLATPLPLLGISTVLLE